MTDGNNAQASVEGRDSTSKYVRQLKAWHRRTVVAGVDHAALLDRANAEGGWSARFAFMIAMSAGIAILGMLLSSPAVVIGAMLISPLMAPIVNAGFSLATFDWPTVRSSLLALAAGTLLAIGFTALLVLASPLQDLTSEILARTRPNLFDLLVAIFSALAGGYATVRGRGETIVGVALATSLMPPLAAVGYGLATWNMAVAGGAFALFLTNFIAIALCMALVARFYGFGAFLTPRQTQRQAFALLVVLVALAVPLGFSLRQIAWEAWATRTIRNAVAQEFGHNSRIVALDPDFAGGKLVVRATVLSDRLHSKATADLERRLGTTLRRPVRMQLSQVLVNQGGAQAELNRARAAEAGSSTAARLAQADLAVRLQFVAGVPASAITVDSAARRALVAVGRDRQIPELFLLEQRLREENPDWDVQLTVPTMALPPILFEDGSAELDARAQAQIKSYLWALQSWGMNGIVLAGGRASNEPQRLAAARMDAVAPLFEACGYRVEERAARALDRREESELGRSALRRVEVSPRDVVAGPGEESAPENAQACLLPRGGGNASDPAPAEDQTAGVSKAA
ncbi:DUF389 domain-containing protein [Sandaracinobacteroides hominis]|uniref:DUF389 domain-containing protein n=1 Tax=Sandaracinobacteroides hominis TaxID=2780086 RepID=UPI0018F56404|nr:DUF389 domain-containing protein [Sandaracinobacteroides hominis]